jgi:hypothetical protein
MKSKVVYGYFGHHKCASTWFEAICQDVCRDLGLDFGLYYDASYFDNDLKSHLQSNSVDFIAYANANFSQIKDIGNIKGFHVVRDPRDIVISAYFSHLYSHPTHAWPELIEYRKTLEAKDVDEGLHMEIDFRREQFDEMRSWRSLEGNESILNLKMEDITAQPYEQMLKVFVFLGLLDESDYSAAKRAKYFTSKIFSRVEHTLKLSLPFYVSKIPAERMLGIVWENSFEKKSGGRTQGVENKSSHYRKGVSGDWVNYFTDEHIAHFKEKYNDVLIQYGYESDDKWEL